MKKIFLLFLFLAAYSTVFSQWESYEVGFNSVLNIWDLDAVDENTVWAITTDGTYSGDAWSVATSAAFTTTSDGGATWTTGMLPFPSNSWSGWKVSAIDADTAWVAASNPFILGAAIYKTSDGGASWTQQNIFSSASFCSVLHFWDANNGVAIGNPVGGIFEIYTTLDGGESWTSVDSEALPNPFTSEFISTSVCSVVGNNIWFGTNQSRVFHSPDQGQNWTASTTPISTLVSNPWVEGIAFQSEMVGIAHSANYSIQPYQSLIAFTEDGGQTWTEQPITVNDFSIFKAQYIEDVLVKTSRSTNGVGPYQTSYSFDHGINWTDIGTETPISDFEFLDNGTAWGGKFKNNNDPTVLYKYAGDFITKIFTPEALAVTWTVAPNPTTDFVKVTIETPNRSDLFLQLNNVTGQRLMTRSLGQGRYFNQDIDLSNFPKGLYYLVIRDKHGKMTTKEIIKQ